MIDFNLNKSEKITINDEIDLILQQIDMLFDTNKMSVLGDPDFGADYDKFLYETYYTNEYIKNQIYDDIINNVELFGWTLNVDVKILNGTENDIILVSINITKDSVTFQQNYKIR